MTCAISHEGEPSQLIASVNLDPQMSPLLVCTHIHVFHGTPAASMEMLFTSA